jgi:mycofactocin precursor
VAYPPPLIVEYSTGHCPDDSVSFTEGGYMEKEMIAAPENEIETAEEPQIIEEIVIEELSIDGVCGVY